MMDVQKYLDRVAERKRTGRVTTEHQLTGLELAKLLNDEKHKSLYIKLAKQYKRSWLIGIAKNISEKKNIKNKGAYFMKVIHNEL